MFSFHLSLRLTDSHSHLIHFCTVCLSFFFFLGPRFDAIFSVFKYHNVPFDSNKRVVACVCVVWKLEKSNQRNFKEHLAVKV